MSRRSGGLIGGVVVATAAASAEASILVTYDGPSGLAAVAQFTILDPTTLEVRLRNVSTGIPAGFSSSDQLLTGVSWDFGPLGAEGVSITGGSVMTGAASSTVNFSIDNVSANSDVSGEWGFGNVARSGALQNFFSTNQAGSIPFGGPNLDGPLQLSGPQGGLISDAAFIPLGGLGAIRDEVVATLYLDGPISEAGLLAALLANGTRVEFGSDAAFAQGVVVPAPGAAAMLGLAGLFPRRRRANGKGIHRRAAECAESATQSGNPSRHPG